MSHPNRRHDDPDDGKSHVVQGMVESVGAKTVARVVIPIALSIIAYFVAADRSDNKEWRREQEQKFAAISVKVDAARSDMLVLTTRLNEGFVRDVRQNKEDITDLKRRVAVIEQTVRVP